MRPSILVAVLAVVVVIGCGDVCTAKEESSSESLRCSAGDGGAGSVLLRPSSLQGNATISGPQCHSSVDGGQIQLRLLGTVCLHASQSSPYTAPLEADCLVNGLAAGTYSVGGSSSFVVLADGGLDLTACGR
ncbi:MAG: hypothetical protein H6Q89_4110 [Myxococcaceae bacterium]|nr:hypothetical protein [Myxococcaceae bacterium]